MKNSDLLKLLDNIKQEETTHSFDKNSRVLLIDGLNLFFRNFAIKLKNIEQDLKESINKKIIFGLDYADKNKS